MIVLFFVCLFGTFFLSLFFPLTFGNLSLWTPSLFVCYLVLCRYLASDDKTFYRYVLLFSVTYGLLYSHYVLFEVFLGFLVAVLLTGIKHYLEVNFLSILLYFILALFLYETLSYAGYSFFHLTSFSWGALLYKISHTLLFNVVLLELCYVFFTKASKTKTLGTAHSHNLSF